MLKNIKINFRHRNNNSISYYLDFYSYFAEIKKDEKLLNKLWCLKTIFGIQKKYIDAFLKLKNNLFYDGWFLLAEVEGKYNQLRKVYHSESDEYEVHFIYRYVKKFQKFFPYKVFLSPEIHVQRFKCNICGKSYKFRKNCNHKVGKLYNGKMCRKIIEEGQLTAISFVSNPVQKYFVVFKEGEDHYNYDLIKSHIANLDSPFHRWEYEIYNNLEPHSSFNDIDKADNCPCGSGKSYESCCLKKEGVIIPYFHVNYERKPLGREFKNYVKFKQHKNEKNHNSSK